MYLLLPFLVHEFNTTIERATAADFEMDLDNFAIGTKTGCNLIAQATLMRPNESSSPVQRGKPDYHML
jgi:hypothetical protein